MKTKYDCYYEYLIVCPHCKHEDELSHDDLGESNTDYEKLCSRCNKKFIYHYETEIKFFSAKANA